MIIQPGWRAGRCSALPGWSFSAASQRAQSEVLSSSQQRPMLAVSLQQRCDADNQQNIKISMHARLTIRYRGREFLTIIGGVGVGVESRFLHSDSGMYYS